MAETHQAEERRIKRSLVALSSLQACAHACHLYEVELVAQPPCKAWSVWPQGFSLAPPKAKASRGSGCQTSWLPRSPAWRLCWGNPRCHGAQALCSPAGPVQSTNGQQQPARSLSAAGSFNTANICSVHLHMQSHQRSSGSQRPQRSLQKKAE